MPIPKFSCATCPWEKVDFDFLELSRALRFLIPGEIEHSRGRTKAGSLAGILPKRKDMSTVNEESSDFLLEFVH